MNSYEGGCQCGDIRYTCTSESTFSFHCHCRQCQQITGTGHASQFAVDINSVEIKGNMKFHNLKADSGNEVKSGFCSNCGSPVLKSTNGYPDMLFIHAATLDDPSLFKPTTVVWKESAQNWDYTDPALG